MGWVRWSEQNLLYSLLLLLEMVSLVKLCPGSDKKRTFNVNVKCLLEVSGVDI